MLYLPSKIAKIYSDSGYEKLKRMNIDLNLLFSTLHYQNLLI